MYHKLIIVGNLGRDPEIRYLPSGDPVTNFSVAVNESWTDREGEKQERTVWYRISAWGRLAEVCNEYLQKGRQVLVEGTLQADDETGGPRVWESRDGQPRASFEVRARRVLFLGSRGSSTSNEPGEEEEEILF